MVVLTRAKREFHYYQFQWIAYGLWRLYPNHTLLRIQAKGKVPAPNKHPEFWIKHCTIYVPKTAKKTWSPWVSFGNLRDILTHRSNSFEPTNPLLDKRRIFVALKRWLISTARLPVDLTFKPKFACIWWFPSKMVLENGGIALSNVNCCHFDDGSDWF